MKCFRSSTAAPPVPRPIPVRTVPRAALDALVARLVARGFRHIPTSEGSTHGG